MAGHEHRALIHRARGTAVFTDNRYGRGNTWGFDGGIEVPASSSPSVVVMLCPQVLFAGTRPERRAHQAPHRRAHEACFIANSVKTSVRIRLPADA